MDAITKPSDAEKLEFNLAQVELQGRDHALQTLSNLVNQLIIDEIHARMRSANYSQKIIERTFLERIEFVPNGEAEIHIKSDYHSESGFDVSEAREKGTAGHRVEPVNVEALSFLINGHRVFSKGHFVSGIIGSHIMENVIQQNSSLVQSEFQRIENEWINQTLHSK